MCIPELIVEINSQEPRFDRFHISSKLHLQLFNILIDFKAPFLQPIRNFVNCMALKRHGVAAISSKTPSQAQPLLCPNLNESAGDTMKPPSPPL